MLWTSWGRFARTGLSPIKSPLADAVEQALSWVHRVREEGKDWELLPRPSVPELYPNMKNDDDGNMMLDSGYDEFEPGVEQEESIHRWVGVKKWLAGELKELTLLWMVGVGKREKAHKEGIYRWDAPDLTTDAVGVTGAQTAATLQQMLAVNTGNGPPVSPLRIEKTRAEWHAAAAVEFYVDFEYCGDPER